MSKELQNAAEYFYLDYRSQKIDESSFDYHTAMMVDFYEAMKKKEGGVSGALLIAKDLLKSIESADPNVVDRYEDSDLVVRDLHGKCSKLIKELSCNDR